MQNKKELNTMDALFAVDSRKRFLDGRREKLKLPDHGTGQFVIYADDLSSEEREAFKKAGYISTEVPVADVIAAQYDPTKETAKDGNSVAKKEVYIFSSPGWRVGSIVFYPPYPNDYEGDKEIIKSQDIKSYAQFSQLRQMNSNTELKKLAKIGAISYKPIRYRGIDVDNCPLFAFKVKDVNNLSKEERRQIMLWQAQQEQGWMVALVDKNDNQGFFTSQDGVSGDPVKFDSMLIDKSHCDDKEIMPFSGDNSSEEVIKDILTGVDEDETDIYMAVSNNSDKLGIYQLDMQLTSNGIVCRFLNSTFGKIETYMLKDPEKSDQATLSVQQYKDLSTALAEETEIPADVMDSVLDEVAIHQERDLVDRLEDDPLAFGKVWSSQEWFAGPNMDKYLKQNGNKYNEMAGEFLSQMATLNEKTGVMLPDLKSDILMLDKNDSWNISDVGGSKPLYNNGKPNTILTSELEEITASYSPTDIKTRYDKVNLEKFNSFLIATNLLSMKMNANGSYPDNKQEIAENGLQKGEPNIIKPGMIHFYLDAKDSNVIHYRFVNHKGIVFGSHENLTEQEQAEVGKNRVPARISALAQENYHNDELIRRKELLEKGDEKGFDGLNLSDNQKSLIKTAIVDFPNDKKPAFTAKEMQLWHDKGKEVLRDQLMEQYAKNYLRYRHDGEEQAALRDKITTISPEVKNYATVKNYYLGSSNEHKLGDKVLKFFADKCPAGASRVKQDCIKILDNPLTSGEAQTVSAGKLIYRMGNSKKELKEYFGKDSKLGQKDFVTYHKNSVQDNNAVKTITSLYKRFVSGLNKSLKSSSKKDSDDDMAIKQIFSDLDVKTRDRNDAMGNSNDSRASIHTLDVK